MKSKGILIIFILIVSACTSKRIKIADGVFYHINKENFLTRAVIKNDTIYYSELWSDFTLKAERPRKDHILESYLGKDSIFNIYIEKLDSGLKSLKFTHLQLQKKDNAIIWAGGLVSYNSLKESKKDNINFSNEFHFTYYNQRAIALFKSFQCLDSIDSATACNLTSGIKQEFRANETQIKAIARYDMYLSGSLKELTTRALIKLKINPLHCTNTELKDAFQKCRYP